MKFRVKDEYITLAQLLKTCDLVSSGGEAKFYLRENEVTVNGEKEDRRGRKLHPGDIVETEGLRIDLE
ncbi:S4 domain-containing protein YaaA [Catenisphaera adipataccumulans]|jgi:ribosome-associated protein|uniref:S4 domain protein YaaA n=1 Tax=Catenisphaera adipataccumulans TaxID=700500 RepID=A0A7W8D1H9_9FIRM|nr:S4 domain-containing protein YaaA [Catenisphaera adipataccumulans]MBB5183845.1 S4 domain protein YaaA [Catenisphaera adipataccumulans]